jgi:hypothetical protein
MTTKIEAISKVLEDNNGIANWNIIYSQIEKYYPNIKSSNQWEAGIRGVLYRAINENKIFKQIGIGLFALQDFKEEKFEEVIESNDPIRMHSFMEGVCIEIGNFLKLKTFTADPSAKYNQLSLSNISILKNIPNFTYSDIVNTTKKIDVLWFNEQGYQFPKRAIEIVDSIGTLEKALSRTSQLFDFNLPFYILSKKEDVAKINKTLNNQLYSKVKNRYIVRDYDSIMNIYKNTIQNMNDNFFNIENLQ